MTSYLRRLATLDPAGSLLQPERARLLLLTGQSSWTSSCLQPTQSAFLRAVAPPGFAVLDCGFPFHRALCRSAVEPGLVAASLRNACQVAWCFTSPRFRRVAADALQRASAATTERLAIVTGSCGLEIANAAWPLLERRAGLVVRIVALGPTCLGRLTLDGAKVSVLRADGDGWSRLLYRGPVDHRAPGGHLDYWASDTVRAEVAALLAGGW